MRHQCEFAALPNRWREAKAAGKPQCHPGSGRVRKSAQRLLSGTALLSSYHIRAAWTEVAETPTTWLQARDAGLEVDHRLQDVAPNPTQGSSHSLGLAGSPSDLSTPPRPLSCGEGNWLLFFRLGIQPHACQMVSRANMLIKSFGLIPAPWGPGSGSLLAGNCFCVFECL